ncbi:MAG: redoxin domain-containing protein [Bacteroidales bacterium]|nr:redoxin domain-containing protein [Bacteroidales bacterium]
MKKTIFTIALMAVMLIATSGLSRGEAALAPGSVAPELNLTSDSQSTALSLMRGDYVLLSFWSSSDAASRVQCNAYSAWVNDCHDAKIHHVGVNFDQEPALFHEITRLDGLDKATQFNVSGSAADRIISDYQLAQGYGTMLIGPDGRIAAINPSTSDLSSLLHTLE